MFEQDPWPQPDGDELNGFSVDGPFEAIKSEDGDYVIIKNCRITEASQEYLDRIKTPDFDPAANEILTVYLQGYILIKPSDTEPTKTVWTAAGRCIYFDTKSDHTITGNELRILKDAEFYYCIGKDTTVHQDFFSNLSNVARTTDLRGTLSQKTGHPKPKG